MASLIVAESSARPAAGAGLCREKLNRRRVQGRPSTTPGSRVAVSTPLQHATTDQRFIPGEIKQKMSFGTMGVKSTERVFQQCVRMFLLVAGDQQTSKRYAAMPL